MFVPTDTGEIPSAGQFKINKKMYLVERMFTTIMYGEMLLTFIGSMSR